MTTPKQDLDIRKKLVKEFRLVEKDGAWWAVSPLNDDSGRMIQTRFNLDRAVDIIDQHTREVCLKVIGNTDKEAIRLGRKYSNTNVAKIANVLKHRNDLRTEQRKELKKIIGDGNVDD